MADDNEEVEECENGDQCWYKETGDRGAPDRYRTLWNNERCIKEVYCSRCVIAMELRELCCICQRASLGKYVMYEGEHYCSRCIPLIEIEAEISGDCTASVRRIAQWIKATHDNATAAVPPPDGVAELVAEAKMRYKQRKRRSATRHALITVHNEKRVSEWVPSFSDGGEAKERVLKKLRYTKLPQFGHGPALLLHLMALEPDALYDK